MGTFTPLKIHVFSCPKNIQRFGSDDVPFQTARNLPSQSSRVIAYSIHAAHSCDKSLQINTILGWTHGSDRNYS